MMMNDDDLHHQPDIAPDHPMDRKPDHFDDDDATPLKGPLESVFSKKDLIMLNKLIKILDYFHEKEATKWKLKTVKY